MFVLVSCILVFLVAYIYNFINFNREEGWVDMFGVAMISGIIASFLTVISFGLSLGVNCEVVNRYKYTYDIGQRYLNIRSLNIRENLNGSFTFGCGRIDDREVYVFYTENKDGSFERDSVDVSGTKIFYIHDGSKPRLKWTRSTTAMKEIKIFNKDISGWFWFSPREWNKDFSLYVPDGSIIESFDLE